jgi:hypothetical protein
MVQATGLNPARHSGRNTLLLGLVLLFAALAALTLLPFSAGKQNDIGYYSICSFVPWSTLALLVVAGVIWAIRQYLMTRAD